MDITVVDDHTLNLRVMGRLWGALGHRPLLLESGEAACKAPALCDLVLMDLHMPGMSGLDAMAQLRRREGAPPIVIVTADVTPQSRDACLAAGAVAVLPKPVTIETLVQMIAALLG